VEAEAASDGPTLLKRGLELAAGSVPAGRAMVSITIPVQPGSGASLLELWPGQTALAYGPRVGIGIAAQLRLAHLDAAAAKDWAQQLWAGIALANGEPPAILCGAAFSPGSTGNDRWSEFPAFTLILPRWTHWQEPGHAKLSLTAPAETLREPWQRDQVIDELKQLTAWLGVSQAACDLKTQPPREMAYGVWEKLVEAAREVIRSGHFQKLVVARSTTLRASGHWSEAEVFEKLRASPGCVPFAARFGKSTFLGATPERLIERRGDRIRTEALAGTAASQTAGAVAGHRDDGADLLRSAKNRAEHQLVVAEIERRLRPLCAELSVAIEPRPRHLKDVVHLQTPMAGRVASGVHILDLACALHPTPAIAGLPSGEAVEWISAHEPEPRGWYAGFIGWFDRSGDGELSVSIRSGLLSEDEAVLYTGAGIVAGSDPSAEYLETAWKQRPFLRALGIELPA